MASTNVSKDKTLADKVIKNFSKVKNSKVASPLKPKQALQPKIKEEKSIFSSIAEILIRSAIEGSKNVKEHEVKKEFTPYKIIKEERRPTFGGYGAVSKSYGSAAPGSSYVDYGSLFSYLGKFRSQGAYENVVGDNTAGNFSSEDNFSLIDKETMDKAGKFVRYFSNLHSDIYSASLSLVPFGGMSGGEWEQFKLWMQIDKVMYKFKTSSG